MEVKEPNARYLVKPGFKQTEVGVIPEDWIVKPIGDFQPFVTSGSRGWAAFYSQFGSPFIRITNLSRECIFPDINDLRFVSIPDSNSEGARTQLKDGDVLISITADIGIVGYVTHQIPKPAYINQHIALVRFDAAQTCPHYVSYFLAGESTQKLFQSLTDSGAKAGMNLSTVKQIRVALPPSVTEQQAIAEALSDADALIEALEQLLAKKRQVKQGVMHELLTGQKRLPEFSGDWEVKQLGELAIIQRGASPRPIDSPDWFDDNSSVGWVRISDVTQSGMYLTETTQRLSPQGVQNSRPVAKGSLIMSICATVGKPVITKIDTCIHDGFVVFDRLNADQRFLYYSLSSIERDWSRHGQTGSQMNLNTGLINSTAVSTPPSIEEQTAIATVLSDLDAELAALEAKLAKACQLKQGMMQELLTGRIRLVQPKAEVIPFPVKKEAKPEKGKPYNWQINEAVVISVLTRHFGSEQWPLGRKRYTKLSYLLHRHVERQAEGYLKKKAGPYNPATKYGGPEAIALKNGYVRQHTREQFSGFVAGEHIGEAEDYFRKWYGDDVLVWLEQFRRKANDDLELLATVDMAMEDLRRAGKLIALDSVKEVIRSHPEWQAKLDRPIFSDDNIERAIVRCNTLFGEH